MQAKRRSPWGYVLIVLAFIAASAAGLELARGAGYKLPYGESVAAVAWLLLALALHRRLKNQSPSP